jgi:hypothetical protein
MREIIVPPSAPAMLNSLRAIGYSFEAALADIVDNSVAAEATSVAIQFRTYPKHYLAVIDNGHGMLPDRLIEAMRHGGVGPDHARGAGDLGRFGLGLKTASFSQCRRLTVITLAAGELSAARWDLNTVEERGDWVLGILSPEESADLPHVSELIHTGHGTIVLWEEFDRATAGESSGDQALGELVDRGRDHLALAFHRYLSGDDHGRKLQITVNNAAVRPADPFLSTHRSTHRLPLESLPVEGAVVTFQPFILPHLSKLGREDLAAAGGEDGLRRNQGFFVYRNRRLITSGTWFRLTRQEELTKLARVQIDIPNSLDHLWALDVKKSAAHPPEAVRAGLRRVIERIANSSREVFRFRGRRTPTGPVTHAWERLVVREGINYVVNRSHPVVVAVRDALGKDDSARLEQLLKTIEISLPTDALYADLASERKVQTSTDGADIEPFLKDLLAQLVTITGPNPADVRRLVDGLTHIEPFSTHPTITRRITEALPNVD